MKNLESTILHHLRERGWDDLRPGDVAKSIMIEGAELLEQFQWDNPTLAETKADGARMEQIKKELADVLIYAIEMSVLLGLDTEAIVREKLAKVAAKYPAELMRKNAQAGAGSGGDSEYWRIKLAHRAKEQ